MINCALQIKRQHDAGTSNTELNIKAFVIHSQSVVALLVLPSTKTSNIFANKRL